MIKYLPIFAMLLFTSCQGKDPYAIETTNPYYLKLEKACNGSSCCRASLKGMAISNATLVPKSGICAKRFHKNMLLCIDSYQWCERDKN